MGLRTERFPSDGVALNIYSGAITSRDLIDQIRALDARGVGRWINYLDPTADLSGMEVASIPDLKRAVAAKLGEIGGEQPARSALVSASPAGALFLEFWPSYVAKDAAFPVTPGRFVSLAAACAWLGLQDVHCTALAAAIAA